MNHSENSSVDRYYRNIISPASLSDHYVQQSPESDPNYPSAIKHNSPERSKERQPLLNKSKPEDQSIKQETYTSEQHKDSSSIKEREYKQECYRFIILALFCISSITNGLCWVTLTPIASTLQDSLDIPYIVINMFSLIYMIVYIPMNFPTNYIIQHKGARVGMVLGMLFTGAGSWIRVAFKYNVYLALAGQLLAAVGQPFLLNAPAKVSNIWFKPESRSIATSIAAVANPVGSALGFVIPPLFVSSTTKNQVQNEVINLMIAEAALATIVFLAVVFFFKEKPEVPPSASAQQERQGFKQSIVTLFKNKDFILLLIAFFFLVGIFNNFGTSLEQIIHNYNFSKSKDNSSLFGALFLLFGIIGSGVLGILADGIRKFKCLLILCALISSLIMLGFIFVLETKSVLWSAIVISVLGFFFLPVLPLSFELACQITFNIGQAMSGGTLMTSCQISGVALVLMTSQLFDSGNNSSSSTSIHNARIIMITMTAFSFVGTFFLVLVKENLKRTQHELQLRQSMKSQTDKATAIRL